MRVNSLRILRLTIELEPGDKYYHVTNPFNPSFYIEPSLVTADLNADSLEGPYETDAGNAVIRAEVTGQRFRAMASGEIKKIPPHRGHPVDRPTVWEFPHPNTVLLDLRRLIRDAYLLR